MHPARLVTLLVLLAGTQACVRDIDFDAIAPKCQDPDLDSPARDVFCSVTVGAQSTLTLGEGEVAVGAHGRDGQVAIATVDSPSFVEGSKGEEIFISFNLTAYQMEASDLLDADTLGAAGPTMVPIDVAVSTTPFDVRILARRGAVTGIALINDTFLVESQSAHIQRNLAGLRFPLDEEEQAALVLQLASIESGETLFVASAIGTQGVKVQRFHFGDDAWEEDLPTEIARPPFLDDNTENNNRGYLLDCGRLTAKYESPSEQVSDDAWQAECVDRCPSCRTSTDVLGVCKECRLSDSFVVPVGFGAFSVTSLTDPDVFFVGGTDIYAFPVASIDPFNWGSLAYEDNDTFGPGGPTQAAGYEGPTIALKDYTLAGESSQTRVALAMEATDDRLYIVAADVFLADSRLDLLVFGHDRGVIDPDILALLRLPEAHTGRFYIRLAVQPNGLVTVRTLPSGTEGFGPPTWVTYDMIDVEEPLEVGAGTFDNEQRWGTGGVAGLPDHLLMPAVDGLRLRHSAATGSLLGD